MRSTKPSSPVRVVAWALGGGVLMFLILPLLTAVIIGYVHGHTGQGTLEDAVPWILTPMAAGMMIIALVVSLVWMRTIDEAAREAHKTAWFWGGSAGMAIGGVGVILANLPQLAAFDPLAYFPVRDDPAAYMALGAAILGLLMIAGYTVVWAWWWLSRMRG